MIAICSTAADQSYPTQIVSGFHDKGLVRDRYRKWSIWGHHCLISLVPSLYAMESMNLAMSRGLL